MSSRLGCVLVAAVVAMVVQGWGEERFEGKQGWKRDFDLQNLLILSVISAGVRKAWTLL